MSGDLTRLDESRSEIDRLSRLYAALSHINQAIAWTPARDDLFRAICSVLVERGGFRLAWVGWHAPDTQRLMPIAEWGDTNGYVKNIEVYGDDRPQGQGPAGRAFRLGRPYVCNDMLGDAATRPWRSEIERCGHRASAAFPIHAAGEVRGVLTVYSAEPGVFRDKEVALLAEVAASLSFALDNIDREAARVAAEEKVRLERDFSNAVLGSLPGVLYLYDDAGRFLRWNENFEKVSGYAAAEILGMHPLQFIAEDDRDLVAARIQEVFDRGESSVEGGFRTKDGRVLPYYFTGVATTI